MPVGSVRLASAGERIVNGDLSPGTRIRDAELAAQLQRLRVTDAHRHGFVTACTALIQALRARDADAAERASRALRGEH